MDHCHNVCGVVKQIYEIVSAVATRAANGCEDKFKAFGETERIVVLAPLIATSNVLSLEASLRAVMHVRVRYHAEHDNNCRAIHEH